MGIGDDRGKHRFASEAAAVDNRESRRAQAANNELLRVACAKPFEITFPCMREE
jgi:hypothetical protein